MDSRDAAGLAGRRILLVEDEMLVALLVEDLLREEGAEVVGPVARVPAALDAVAAGPDLDAALLDVNLNGTPVWPVAEALRARGVPYILLTGYGSGIVPPELVDAALLTKPVAERDLLDTLRRVVGKGRC